MRPRGEVVRTFLEGAVYGLLVGFLGSVALGLTFGLAAIWLDWSISMDSLYGFIAGCAFAGGVFSLVVDD